LNIQKDDQNNMVKSGFLLGIVQVTLRV